MLISSLDNQKIKDIKNMYYISYFQATTGGLPVAAKLGEDVCKYL